MKDQNDPITEDEWLLRLVWEDRFVKRDPPISLNAFEPRDGRHPDTEGISLFREACVENPEDILAVVAADKRHRYGIVKIPVSMLAGQDLTVRPDNIEEVPGHVVMPELNLVAYSANPNDFLTQKQALARISSENIVLRPRKLDG